MLPAVAHSVPGDNTIMLGDNPLAMGVEVFGEMDHASVRSNWIQMSVGFGLGILGGVSNSEITLNELHGTGEAALVAADVGFGPMRANRFIQNATSDFISAAVDVYLDPSTSGPAELGGAGVPQSHLLQQARQGRSLRGVGAA